MTSMTRRLLLLVVVRACVAWAAAPRGIGSAKEDEPCPAPVGTAEADLAILRGLQFAFEPAPIGVRVQAIEDLGFLQDARALNPLSVLTLDPNPPIAMAAIRAVGSIRHPRAEEILSNLVRHPTASTASRVAALKLIQFQNTPTALRFVYAVARQTQGTPEVIATARTLALSLHEPSLGDLP